MTTVYGTIADWRTYASARGDSDPTDATDTDALAALTRASDYIRLRYVVGFGISADDDTLEEAAYIAAPYELSDSGFWSTTYTPAKSKVLTEVKGIKWEPIGSSDASAAEMEPVCPAIEALLKPLIAAWKNRTLVV